MRRSHKNKSIAKRVDEENYTFTALTKTGSCKGCACAAHMYCAGIQEGARHYIGNATAFYPIGRTGYAVCDMGFYVYEGLLTDDPLGNKYPIPLEPCPKPPSRRYASFSRFTDEIKNGREDVDILINRFSSKYFGNSEQLEDRC